MRGKLCVILCEWTSKGSEVGCDILTFSFKLEAWNIMLKWLKKFFLILKDYRTFIFSFPPDYKCWKNNLSYGILGTQFPFPATNWKYRVYACLIPICQLNSSEIKSIIQFLRLFISYMLDHGPWGVPFISWKNQGPNLCYTDGKFNLDLQCLFLISWHILSLIAKYI